MIKSDSQTAKEIPTPDKFHEIEVEQLFQAIMNTQSLRLQMGIFFGTVYLGAFGIAFSLQYAGLIMLASVLPLVLVVADWRIDLIAHKFYLRATQLESEFAPNEGKTFLTLPFTPWQESFARSMMDYHGQDRMLSSYRVMISVSLRSVSAWLLPLASIGGLVLGLVLWLEFGWLLF
jgi:hypothetical protein